MTLFFYGPNTYALRLQLRQMVEAYLAKAKSDFGLERIDGGVIRAQELLSALQATPFLATSRLVIIDGLASNKSFSQSIASTLAKVPATTVAVFVEHGVDQRTSLFKDLSKADKVIKFEDLTGPKLLYWIRTEVERLHGTIEAAAIRELIELAGEDQWRLSEEINKVVNYDLSVTVESIRTLVLPSVERSIFDLVEAMTTGRIESALIGYHGLLRQKESEMYVLTMIQWQVRNLLLAKSAPAAMSPSEFAKLTGMSPYVAGKMAVSQKNISEAILTQAYIAAGDCEYDIKTGRTRSDIAVEQLLYAVSARVGR
jgi:DNA polymerase-3 subunit delta